MLLKMYRSVELPTIRRYPKGHVSGKISNFKGGSLRVRGASTCMPR
jgi:hypothetical protein